MCDIGIHADGRGGFRRLPVVFPAGGYAHAAAPLPGRGMGLPICRSLVERMGGTIGVERELGKGSRFWFEILLTTVASVPEPAVAPSRGGALPPARILVVEDNRGNQRVAAHMLSRLGL